ncbi:MAG: hydroxymethylbilane synthase [Planctomycetia bacterium]|nr:hydroxymethylbilane synthase [Planctomycetia bacterium]
MPNSSSSRPLRIGTRASALARWQAEWVADQLRARGVDALLVTLTTRGDREQAQSIGTIGGEGVFTKEIQRALLADEIDLAVHSLKDLPTEPVEGLVLAAVPKRHSPADVLVSREGLFLDKLRPGAVVGTGSLRRRAQLWHKRPDLVMNDIRGNVDTRLRKVGAGDYDAIVLAEAGLARLGLESHVTEVLSKSVMLPACGQGALGLECREGDAATYDALAPLDDPHTHRAVDAERAMLRALRGGCLAPVGGWGRVESDGRLWLTAVVLAADGRQRLSAESHAAPAEAAEMGRRVAADLIAQGAAQLIEATRAERPEPGAEI